MVNFSSARPAPRNKEGMAASATSADISLTAHFPDRDLDAMVATANSYLTGDAEGASLDVQIVELLVAVTISIERGQITHAERFLEAAEALAPRTTWLFFVTAVDVLWAIVRRNQDRLAEAAAHLAVARDAPFTASDADRVASIVASSPLLRKALSLMLAELNAALQQQPAADAGIGGTTRPQWWLNPDELSRHSLPPVSASVSICFGVWSQAPIGQALSGVRAVRANTDFTPSSSEHRFLAFRQGETFCVLARHSRTMFKAQVRERCVLAIRNVTRSP
jgi:hypothetical protein